MTDTRALDLVQGDGGNVSVPLDKVVSTITHSHFIYFYDAARCEQDNVIHAEDWGLPGLLGARWWKPKPTLSELRGSEEGWNQTAPWQQINDALAHVPPGWRLEDQDAPSYQAATASLVDIAMSVTNIGPAIATKVLHKKRPNLIPVVDTAIWAFYRKGGGVHAKKKPVPDGQVAGVIFDSFREDLTNNLVLARQASSEVASSSGVQLTPLRIVELAIWLKMTSAWNT